MATKSQVLLTLLLLFSTLCSASPVEKVHVAVASNFLPTLKRLAIEFEQQRNIEVVISAGSSGKLFAQISHGAPFDLFLSADRFRPQSLAKNKNVNSHGRFTYAIGQLAIWHPGISKGDFNRRLLLQQSVKRIAIANPRTAPYGQAAIHWLAQSDLLKSLQGKLVRGESVGQVLQFVQSKNAQVGFVSLSNLLSLNAVNYSLLAQQSYPKIEQQGIILSKEQSTSLFVDFLQSTQSRAIIKQSGYQLP